MQPTHGSHTHCPVAGQKPAPYIRRITAGASPPPLRPLRSLLAGTCSCNFVAPLSPRAGPHSFFSMCDDCMADMSAPALPTGSVEFILRVLLRRAPNPPPSDPVSQHRTEIVSSSLDQGSPAERIPSSLALCHHFGFGFGPVIRPCLRTGPFFSCRTRLASNELCKPALRSAQQARWRLKWARPY